MTLLVLILLSLAAASVRSIAVNQSSRYFEQAAQAWRGVSVTVNDTIELRMNYQFEPLFRVENSSGTLFMSNATSRALDAVRTDASGEPLARPLCPERRILVHYIAELFLRQGDYAGTGLPHKIVLASDDERDNWPAGLGFAFGTGTIKSLVLFHDYDYGNPVAFVYRHEANNTCNAEAKNTCVPFQNKTIPGQRTYLGNYTVDLEARIDVSTAQMHWHSLRVHLSNATFDGTILESSDSALLGGTTVNATRWLASTKGAARIYFMSRRTQIAFRNLAVDVVDQCVSGTDEPAFNPPSHQHTTLTAPGLSSQSSGAAIQSGESRDGASDDGSDSDATTFIIFAVVISVLVCILVVVAIVCLVRWRRRRAAFRERAEAGSSSSDDRPMPMSRSTSEYGNLPVRYVQGRGMVPIESEYARAPAPPAKGFYQRLVMGVGGFLTLAKARPAPVYDSVMPPGDAEAEEEMRKTEFARKYAFTADVADVETSGESSSHSRATAQRRAAASNYDQVNSRFD